MAQRTKSEALAEFVDALRDLGPQMEAIGQLACVAVELQRWGTSLELSVHNVSRGEFDSFDGETTHFPAGEESDREWWSKRVELYRGDVDMNREPPVEGRVSLLLYTDEPPVELFDDSHDGATDLTMAGEHDWRL